MIQAKLLIFCSEIIYVAGCENHTKRINRILEQNAGSFVLRSAVHVLTTRP